MKFIYLICNWRGLAWLVLPLLSALALGCGDLRLKGDSFSNEPDQASTLPTVGGPGNLPASGTQSEVTGQVVDMDDNGIADGIDLNGDGVSELKFIDTGDPNLAGLDLDGDGAIDYYISFATDPVQILDSSFLHSDYTLAVDDNDIITGVDFNGDGQPEDTGLESIHGDGSPPFLSASGLPGIYADAIDVDFFCVDDYACHSIAYSIDGPSSSTESILLNINDGLALGGDEPGVYTLNYRAVDYAGNEGPVYTLAITIVGSGFSVSANGSQTDEDGGTVVIDVSLEFAPSAAVTIPVQVTRPGEAMASTSSLVLDATNLTGQIIITGKDDDVDDGNRNYRIRLGPTSSADDRMDGLPKQSVQLTNVDNDTAGVMVLPAGGLITSEAGAQDTFTVYLASKPKDLVVIDLATLSGNNDQIVISPTQIDFTTGNWDSPQTITVTGQDDGGADSTSDTDTVVLTMNTVGTQDAVYDALTGLPQLGVTNMDDDGAGIIVNPVDDNNLTIGQTHSIDISLTSAPAAGTVTVSFTNPDAGALSLSHSSFDFTSADFDTIQTLVVTAVDSDNIASGIKNLTITTGISAPSDPAYDGLSVPDIDVNVTDDDTAGLALAGTGGLVTGEDGTSDSFTVALTSEPTAPVDVVVSSSNSGEGNFGGSASTTLNFSSANWSTPQPVNIDGVDDAASPVRDGSVAYTVTLNPSGATEYNSVSNSVVNVTNLDNDRFLFVSTSNVNGDFGGISGADNICNTDTGRPDTTVTYKAMISTDGSSRRASVNPYSGDGQLDWVLEADTNYMRNEPEEDVLIFQTNGDKIFDFSTLGDADNAISGTSGHVWTGMKGDWTSLGKHCQFWSTSAGAKEGVYGLRNALDNTMLRSGPEGCNTLNRIYCVEQP